MKIKKEETEIKAAVEEYNKKELKEEEAEHGILNRKIVKVES